MSILFCTFVVEIKITFSPPETRIIGYYMLHIEWIMANRENLKEFRHKLNKLLPKDFGDSYQFTERHMVLALDLGTIYSYRDTQKALRYMEDIRTTWCLQGFISNIDFTI